jgi:hypothetical protein
MSANGAHGKPEQKCSFDKSELRRPLIVAAIRSDYRARHRVPVHPLPRFAMSGPDNLATRMNPADIEFGAADR